MRFHRIRIVAAFLLGILPVLDAIAAEGPIRWCVYMTNGSVRKLASDDAALKQAPELLRNLHVTKVYVEFFRASVIPNDDVKKVMDALKKEGFEVAGGFATLPGEDIGVKDNGKLNWANWQAQKTRDDFGKLVKSASPLFSEYIIDDFFCTSDTSDESATAKGDLKWSDYRRALLTQAATESMIVPAKTANPSMTVIIKFPQWYDRFQEFGYDVPAESALFDRVWVGTETRGAMTQRYGFTQPYMGFINYRWISSIAADKTAGAWFDHGDCDANDFIDQAYQSVLAGAREIMLFCYEDIAKGHPGHEMLRKEQPLLDKLAETVAQSPVTGVAAYKPANSDAGPDLFIMDYIGMLGVPLVPFSREPMSARSVFLPTQAAADPAIGTFVKSAIAQRATIVMTAGFLAAAPMRDDLMRAAGLRGSITLNPMRAGAMRIRGEDHTIAHGLDLAANIALGEAKPLLMADVNGRKVPYFTQHDENGAKIYVLNTRTFSQEDYDAVGEVLLPPRQLGILELPEAAVKVIRDAFTMPLGYAMEAPARVTLQPLGNTGFVIQNYTPAKQTVRLSVPYGSKGSFVDEFTGKTLNFQGRQIDLPMNPRSRIWLRSS